MNENYSIKRKKKNTHSRGKKGIYKIRNATKASLNGRL